MEKGGTPNPAWKRKKISLSRASKFKEDNKGVGVESEAMFLAEGTKSEKSKAGEHKVCQELGEV